MSIVHKALQTGSVAAQAPAGSHVSQPQASQPDSISRKSKKRLRLDPTASEEGEITTKECYLTKVPLEILAEILSHTSSPRDVLALARCSKYFCATLVKPSSNFIWRHARERCLPNPVPDPLPNFTEASYAALLFDGGHCEICKKRSRAMYWSFLLRARFCDNPKCLEKWKATSIMKVNSRLPDRYKEVVTWLPSLERSITNPADMFILQFFAEVPSNSMYVRVSDWKQAVDELNKALVSSPAMDEYLRKKQSLADQLPAKIEWSKKLVVWRDAHQAKYREVKNTNDSITKDFARVGGWEPRHLLQSQTYSTLYRSKNVSLEGISQDDFNAVRSAVAEEITQNVERSGRRKMETAYATRRDEVKQLYQSASHQKELQGQLPNLGEFRKLPVMRVLQATASGESATQTQNVQESILVTALMKDNLRDWQKSTRAGFAALLGFADWRNASKNKLHPVDRLTARFRCKNCDVRKNSLDAGSFTFDEACKHTCWEPNKKQRARQTWSVKQFTPDQQVIDFVYRVLRQYGVNAEDAASLATVPMHEPTIVCLSCPSKIVMDLDCAMKHCRRHPEMDFTVVSPGEAQKYLQGGPFKPGATLLNMCFSQKAGQEPTPKTYGCRHCRNLLKPGAAPENVAGEQQVAPAGSIRVAMKQKLYSFNGLRSHVKAKHGIERIGDEDFFEQKP
ncbi:hypothetical protein OBBRIDRAFT_796411 [Obba rivulosa]|uniref:F-box domain-containing protein n=1 Tax=Obba rivulosa TaxID=1052685 RepID=A0A8E2AN21_9APHY|nr:hypothetical protein OBBRIDRAFT_796411 [Obba rivulosa]